MKVTLGPTRRGGGVARRMAWLALGALALAPGAQQTAGGRLPSAAREHGTGLPLPPSGVRYPVSELHVPEGQPIAPLSPTVARGPVESFALAPGASLPAGLELDPATGTLSGTPSELFPPGELTVLAVNSGGATAASLVLEVFGVAPSSLDYSPPTLEVELRGGPFTATPSVAGGPVDAWAVLGAPLPPGLVLDPVSGILSGDPTTLQPPTLYTIEASNETGSTTFSFLIEVSLPPPPDGLSYPSGQHVFTLGEAIPPLVPEVDGRVDVYRIDPPLPNRLLTVSGGTVLPRTGVLLPENPTPIPYTPPEQTLVHPWEVLNVWLPAGTAPDEGWPCVLGNPDAGYFGAPPYGAFDPADPALELFHRCLNAGIAVVFAGIVDSGPVTAWFTPPGHPSGNWEDDGYLMPEKDLLHALQWVKSQGSYPIDPNRVFLHGVSAGSTLAAWIALGPDLARPSGSQQVRTSTTVAGVLCFDTLLSFPAYDPRDQLLPHHWESVMLPGMNAVDMGDADPAVLDANSLARVILDPRSNAPTTPVFLAYDCFASSIDYANDPDHFPLLRGFLGPNVHDLWHGAKLWERLHFLNRSFHGEKSEFWISSGFESTLGSLAGAHTGTFTGTALDSSELYDGVIAWMLERSRETIPDPDGLRLHPWSGYVLGTPNLQAPPRQHAVTATSPSGASQATVLIRVDGGGPNR